MMRLWFNWYGVRVTLIGALVASIVFHAATITAWVFATMPQPNVEQGSIANHVFYLPPPDRVKSPGGSGERVSYVKFGPEGPGSGEGARLMGDARPTAISQSLGRDTTAKDTVATQPAPAGPPDSVFSVLEVDTAVARLASSAAPAYPLKLLDKHVQGYVDARYVVDTTGFADTSTFEVLKSTNKEFVDAVRDALPYMRFAPAKIGSAKVRQLVQQQFTFKISDADSAKASPKTKKPGA
jgi:hypothetical protein